MRYIIIFEQRGDSLRIFSKDDLTPDQMTALNSVNGFLQNNDNEADVEAILDDICGEVFDGQWDDDKIYDSDDDMGTDGYEINAPLIGVKLIHIGSV